ncbi:MAG: VOC family protein [Planctomycetota bacterium]
MKKERQAAAARPSFRGNNEIALHVPDLAKAEAFYIGVMGLRLIAKTPDQLTIDAGALRLYVNRDSQLLQTFIPSFDVSNYPAARRHLEAAGTPTTSAGEHSPSVYFRDPFGFVFDLVERT